MEFNLAEVHEAVAEAYPDRECIVWRDRRLTYADVTERTRRLANALHAHGLGAHRERAELGGHESGQDHLALYLYNGNEYLEGMLGAFKARVAPFNVNYRYVTEELRYLFTDSGARAVIYHEAFAPTLAEVRSELPALELLIQVADESGHGLAARRRRLRGAPGLVVGRAARSSSWSPDDLYILYTGGTTGMPKGVLWRQNDIFIGAMGGRPFGRAEQFDEPRGHRRGGAERRRGHDGHAAAHARRRPVVHLHHVHRRQHGGDPVRGHPPRPGGRVVGGRPGSGSLIMQIVGDAFARPLIDELGRHDYDLTNLVVVVNGGAPMNPTLKERLLEKLPNAFLLDAVGSSETGAQMGHTSTKGTAATGQFTPGPGTVVVNEDGRPPPGTRVTSAWAGWPRRVTCRSATSVTPRRPLARSR